MRRRDISTRRTSPPSWRSCRANWPAGRSATRIEARHPSFADPRFLALAAEAGAAIVIADSDDYPAFADATGDFIYARLQRGRNEEPTCYPPSEIDRWADRVKIWSRGDEPEELGRIGEKWVRPEGRDVFLFFINKGKVRAPAAAEALLARVRR